MMYSEIEVIGGYVSAKGVESLFIINGNTTNLDAIDSWERLKERARNISINRYGIDLEEISLYDSVRGFFEERGIEYKSYGSLPRGDIMKVDDSDNIESAENLFSRINQCRNIEERVHSSEDEKRIENFKKDLEYYASRIN